MMPPLQQVCNRLARPADESILALDNGKNIGTTGHSENTKASAAQPAET